MRLTRRSTLQLLGASAASAALPALPGCKTTLVAIAEGIANRPMRRDIETLAADDPDLLTFRQGVQLMRDLPKKDRRNWENMAKVHNDHCPHGGWMFLPWHRAYLSSFEKVIRTLTGQPRFALPYWNWARSRRVPAAFWGADNPLQNLHEDGRAVTATSVADEASVGCDRLTKILGGANFETFGSGRDGTNDNPQYGVLEGGPHNYVHGNFVRGTMRSLMSPLDPLFWAHHGMVEACWFEWNLNRGNDNPNDSAWLERRFTEFCDGDGNKTTVRVGDLLLLPVVDFQYDALYLPCSPPPPPPQPSPQRKRYKTDTPAEAEAARAHVQAGADVRLRVVDALPAALPAPLDVRDRAVLTIAAPPEKRAALRALPARQQALITVELAELERPDDFFIRVFVGQPDAGPDTPADDPHDVGILAFFGHDHAGHHAGTMQFTLDARGVLAAAGDDPTITLVLVPREGAPPSPRRARVTRVAVSIVEPLR